MFQESEINLNYDDVQKIFSIIDEDASGALTKDEFKTFLLAKDSKEKFRVAMREIKETAKNRLKEQKAKQAEMSQKRSDAAKSRFSPMGRSSKCLSKMLNVGDEDKIERLNTECLGPDLDIFGLPRQS